MYSVDTILGHVNYLPAIENNNPTTDQHLVLFLIAVLKENGQILKKSLKIENLYSQFSNLKKPNCQITLH